MFTIRWKEDEYTFNEDFTMGELKTVVNKDLIELERYMIAMSVNPKIKAEDIINNFPALLYSKIRKKIVELLEIGV